MPTDRLAGELADLMGFFDGDRTVSIHPSDRWVREVGPRRKRGVDPRARSAAAWNGPIEKEDRPRRYFIVRSWARRQVSRRF